MRILHLMLSSFYIDGWNYQENQLPRQNKRDGHDVQIIASTEMFMEDKTVGYVTPSRYVNEDGIPVLRLPYSTTLPHRFMKKIRAYPDCIAAIEEFHPDVILHHGASGYELLRIAKYVQRHPTTKLFVDSHADFHNSAQDFLSRELLHRKFYAPILRASLPQIEKILCISLECMDFLETLYHIPRSAMEFYPLGGQLVSPKERETRRARLRKDIGLSEDIILMVHSGKMNTNKRTIELLQAFSKVSEPSFSLHLVGSIDNDIKKDIDNYITRDSRIQLVGWKTAEELLDYLCAADMYLQPGSQSATMQNALCCSCPVMLYPYKSHEPYLHDNGFFIKTVQDMEDVFKRMRLDPSILKAMSSASFALASTLLDYRKLAARLYE